MMTGSCVRIASNWSPFILSMSFLILLLPDYRWNDYSTNTQYLFILRPCSVFCNTYCCILFYPISIKKMIRLNFLYFYWIVWILTWVKMTILKWKWTRHVWSFYAYTDILNSREKKTATNISQWKNKKMHN